MPAKGQFIQIGRRAWSYSTALLDVLEDGQTVGNITKYSPTTSRHQNEAGVHSADIKLDGVPRGTEDLAAYYHQQRTLRQAA